MPLVHVDGASGYAAGEVARLVAGHPEFALGVLASRSHAGEPVGDVFPTLRPLGLRFATPEALDAALAPDDALLFAGEAADAPARVSKSLERGARVVDLSAAFRLRDAVALRTWYGIPMPAQCAVYGLPELHRDAIRGARFVANPGCYPTATLLAIAPSIAACSGRVAQIIVDAKSGVSGAGRVPKTTSLYAEVHDGVRPYGLQGHRHAPEIKEQLQLLPCHAALTFVPHVVPLSRGLLVTCYIRTAGDAPDASSLAAAYARAYANNPLVHVLDGQTLPDTRAVARTARASIGVAVVAADMIVAACALDNLGKGAAAQAVQNLNLMYGFAEGSGLGALAGVA